MNLCQTFYIKGIKVETDPLGIKVFGKSKEECDLIHSYYEKEFLTNGLTNDGEKDIILT